MRGLLVSESVLLVCLRERFCSRLRCYKFPLKTANRFPYSHSIVPGGCRTDVVDDARYAWKPHSRCGWRWRSRTSPGRTYPVRRSWPSSEFDERARAIVRTVGAGKSPMTPNATLTGQQDRELLARSSRRGQPRRISSTHDSVRLPKVYQTFRQLPRQSTRTAKTWAGRRNGCFTNSSFGKPRSLPILRNFVLKEIAQWFDERRRAFFLRQTRLHCDAS